MTPGLSSSYLAEAKYWPESLRFPALYWLCRGPQPCAVRSFSPLRSALFPGQAGQALLQSSHPRPPFWQRPHRSFCASWWFVMAELNCQSPAAGRSCHFPAAGLDCRSPSAERQPCLPSEQLRRTTAPVFVEIGFPLVLAPFIVPVRCEVIVLGDHIAREIGRAS